MASWRKSTVTEIGFDDVYPREYEWEYRGERFSWEMKLPEDIYDMHSRRHRTYDYGSYVADEVTQTAFDEFCESVREVCAEDGFSSLETVEFLTRFVQSLEYTPDKVSTGYDNYPRYPIETLVDEEGDCEDSSLLLASLLYGMGYRVVLLELDEHLAVGVEVEGVAGNVEFDGTEYSYVEPTGTGWDIGVVPHEYEDDSVARHRIEDSPALYSRWAGETNGDTLDCGGSIINHGRGKARDVVFQLMFNDTQGKVVSAVEKEWASLRPGSQVEWSDSAYIEPNCMVEPEWVVGIEGVIHDRGKSKKRRT
jgi:hypothetical protein